jgi:hypothetical protein
VLVFPRLDGQVAGLGEGGADVGVFGSEGGRIEVDFHEGGGVLVFAHVGWVLFLRRVNALNLLL